MGRILTVASWKGGSAKTTFATNLAVNLASLGYCVAAVDADPNRHLAGWFEIAEGVALTCTAESREDHIAEHIRARAERSDMVIVDTAGFHNATAVQAMAIADFVGIPIMPDRASVIEAIRTARQVVALGTAAGHAIPYRIIKSRWNPRGLIERALETELRRNQLTALVQHLSPWSDVGKFTLSGVPPNEGRIADQAQRIIEELVALGAVPAHPREDTHGRVHDQADRGT
jgi:chromosome partitioning protein